MWLSRETCSSSDLDALCPGFGRPGGWDERTDAQRLAATGGDDVLIAEKQSCQ